MAPTLLIYALVAVCGLGVLGLIFIENRLAEIVTQLREIKYVLRERPDEP
jgi:hypothetical protein